MDAKKMIIYFPVWVIKMGVPQLKPILNLTPKKVNQYILSMLLGTTEKNKVCIYLDAFANIHNWICVYNRTEGTSSEFSEFYDFFLSKLTELFQEIKKGAQDREVTFFVVMDGTAPFMKAQNQVCSRGEVSPELTLRKEVKDRILLTENGQEILDNLDVKPREVISQLHITPGSKFIIGLNDFLTEKLKDSEDTILINQPGEGEHNIVRMVRANNDPDTAHYIFSSDGDVIILSAAIPQNKEVNIVWTFNNIDFSCVPTQLLRNNIQSKFYRGITQLNRASGYRMQREEVIEIINRNFNKYVRNFFQVLFCVCGNDFIISPIFSLFNRSSFDLLNKAFVHALFETNFRMQWYKKAFLQAFFQGILYGIEEHVSTIKENLQKGIKYPETLVSTYCRENTIVVPDKILDNPLAYEEKVTEFQNIFGENLERFNSETIFRAIHEQMGTSQQQQSADLCKMFLVMEQYYSIGTPCQMVKVVVPHPKEMLKHLRTVKNDIRKTLPIDYCNYADAKLVLAVPKELASGIVPDHLMHFYEKEECQKYFLSPEEREPRTILPLCSHLTWMAQYKPPFNVIDAVKDFS